MTPYVDFKSTKINQKIVQNKSMKKWIHPNNLNKFIILDFKCIASNSSIQMQYKIICWEE